MTINPGQMRRTCWGRVCVSAALMVTAAGCGTVKTTGTARTGTEQLLLTNAWDTALQKVDFRPLTGVPVFLDTSNITVVDQGWVVSSMKQAMLTQGVLLRPKAELAQWIVEARVGVYGTDSQNWLFGIPQTTVPQTITGMPSGTIPEIALAKKTDQQGMTKLALFAYDRGSGQIVWTSGTMFSMSTAKDLYFGGVGPIQSGTIRPGGTEFIGMKLPLTAEGPESEEQEPDPKAAKAKSSRFALPALRIPPSTSDADSFSP
jgi:hypothetical protein